MACDCVLCINDVVATFVFEPMAAREAALADSLSAISAVEPSRGKRCLALTNIAFAVIA